MKQAQKQEISAGGVVYRRLGVSAGQQARRSENQKIQFLIGKHSGYHKWVLPKGMVEPGEETIQTAAREVEEEVGVVANIVSPVPLKVIEYFYMADLDTQKGVSSSGEITERRVVKYQEDGGGKVRVHKKVLFYLMESKDDLGQAGWEMEERRWVDYALAMEMLAFETERGVLTAAGKVLKLRLGASAET